ncbi:MAG: hypothetical protein WAZ12_01950 [Candidatus Absconditicoccaceae bacterium]
MKSFKFIMLLLCFGLIYNISLGQSGTTQASTGNAYTGELKEAKETLKLQQDTMEKIERIAYAFCNDGILKEKTEITARPGERKEICVTFGNKNPESVNIIFGFPNGTIDKEGRILCDVDLTGNTYIKSLLKGDTKSDFYFDLMPKQQIVKKFYIAIPKTQTGNIYGCGSFKIKGNLQKAASGSMFNIEIVKKATIDISITGNIYNYGLLDDIKYAIADNKQNILKGFIIVVGLWLVISIIQSSFKKKHRKNQKK